MTKTRLEAFSDGVLAIIITIMVLEIKVPHDASVQALINLFPIFTSYVLSFFFVGIYWVNHHHLLHMINNVHSKILWANMGLLFSLSLIPFTTSWMGENHYASLPVAIYCSNLLLCGFAAYFLQIAITYKLPPDDEVFVIIKKTVIKTYFSVSLNIISIPCAFYYPLISLICIAVLCILWVIPDKGIEKVLEEKIE
ncbi:MAG: TMEM175 family protein [Bacteroidota bacterium]|nr:TMEM175 family protein [Bacteroidota bacterium]